MATTQSQSEEGVAQFDNSGQLRLCDLETHEHGANMLNHASSFLEKIDQFRTHVSTSLQTMNRLAQAIEKVKLAAVGARCHADMEVESRAKQRAMLEIQLKEKQQTLDRKRSEHNALEAVLYEQQRLVERLSQSE
eukprot:PhF_6_TR39651/c0_g1_i2/m.58827/K16473/IFT20; intraflagellar transport protein 20